MELKVYQQKVITDLKRYLELLGETCDSAAAYHAFWQEKGAAVGKEGLPPYQDIISGVPALCFKVPTGGGKTFLACNSVRPIFDALPFSKARAVVWLVPSDAILTQTLKCLKSPEHPYRQSLCADFGGRVEVYSKQELLNGQNFNPTAVTEQLSVMVLSYDSFRRQTKDGLKAFQENSALMGFNSVLGQPELPIEGADETSLFQVINQLSPLVIVDESHHARTELSLEMLKNFNPCFVLDLTATPRRESNIISFVDAWQLKREEMVKLPVVVYNRNTQDEVLDGAIALRNKLEEFAIIEQESGGQYIRPIVLFQAQPHGSEDSATFEKIRELLVEDWHIQKEQIAIRTASINELKDVDLMSPDCPVRYIITVNALREGWDCPFAYILASLANRTSLVDVEQILGRVLRMPGARKSRTAALNMSYVLTSSSDFNRTIQQIVAGLNNAGFTEKDCRAAAEEPALSPEDSQIAVPFEPEPHSEGQLEKEQRDEEHPAAPPAPIRAAAAEAMLTAAGKINAIYETEERKSAGAMPEIPVDVQSRVKQYPIKGEFQEETKTLTLPQFFYKVPQSFFLDGEDALLHRELLAKDFTLKGKSYDIDFTLVDEQIVRVDVKEDEGGLPKVFKLSSADQRFFREWFDSLPQESRIRECKRHIVQYLDNMNMLSGRELRIYVDNIIDGLDSARLALLEKDPTAYAARIKEHIEGLLTEHYKKTFKFWVQTEKITCRPNWHFPAAIHPTSTADWGRSLYEAEESMNALESDLAGHLTALSSIRWWHRNINRLGFCINGFINHYPDFIIRTQAGKIVVVETKGAHLKNDDSRDKIELGQMWANAAGAQYRYYMVFADSGEPLKDAYSESQFLEILKEL